MRRRDVTYHNPIYQEEHTPLVTITETDIDKRQSAAVDGRKVPYVVDLSKASFGGITYPEPGSQWLIKKVSGRWTLMARGPRQNPQLDSTLDPQPGDTLIGSGVRTVIVGDAHVTGTLTISGSGLAMVGEIRMWPTITAPTDWHLCDGTSLLRATYPDLSSLLNPSIGVATMTIATPCVVSFTSHGLSIGDKVFFTTTGALPTGVSANTTYWVISAGFGANSFRIAATQGGTAINTSGSQSGVHTLWRTYFGIADSTHFNVPNFKGRVLPGRDSSQTEFAAIGMTGGEKTHTMVTADLVAHTHTGPSHTHTGPSHTHTGPSHTHTGPSHTHGAGTLATSSTGAHVHNFGRDQDGATGSSEWVSHSTGITGAEQNYSNAMTSAGDHTHTFSGATASDGTGNTGSGGTGDTGSSGTGNTGSSGTGDTGSTGSSTAFNVLNPYSPINYIIRLT